MAAPETKLTLPKVSKEYFYVPGIEAFDPTAGEADVTELDVFFAIAQPNADPEDDAWAQGSWSTDAQARILIGTDGDIEPEAGTWWVWVRVDGALERPERPVAVLKVF